MEAMMQMNVRIPTELKHEGDKGLAELGLTPSQAVRRLYELVVRKPRDQMREMLATPEETDEQARERERKLKVLEDFRSWQQDMYAKMGISRAVDSDSPSSQKHGQHSALCAYDYKELLHEALMERYAERGLL